jgi:hypothetical protein
MLFGLIKKDEKKSICIVLINDMRMFPQDHYFCDVTVMTIQLDLDIQSNLVIRMSGGNNPYSNNPDSNNPD